MKYDKKVPMKLPIRKFGRESGGPIKNIKGQKKIASEMN